MRKTYKVGDIVQVNNSVFVASPIASDKWTDCKVLPGSSGSQLYVSPVGKGSPMYVFRHHIKGDTK